MKIIINYYMTIEKIIAEEKIQLLDVKSGSDHRLIRDRWLAVKRLLDAIYQELSPFENGEQKNRH